MDAANKQTDRRPPKIYLSICSSTYEISVRLFVHLRILPTYLSVRLFVHLKSSCLSFPRGGCHRHQYQRVSKIWDLKDLENFESLEILEMKKECAKADYFISLVTFWKKSISWWMWNLRPSTRSLTFKAKSCLKRTSI